MVLVVASSRLLFSPLRAYPGPLLARLTNGYAGLHAIKGDIHLVTYLDHLKYGKITADWRFVYEPTAYSSDPEQDQLSGKPRTDSSSTL